MEDWRRHIRDEPAERAEQRRRHAETAPVDPSWSGRGRMSRGWELVDDSWAFLRRRPRLLVLPAISAVATGLAALVLFVPTLYLTRDLSAKVSFFIAGAVCAAPFAFISTFFNVAFLAMV